jgi:outer membrane protein
MSKLGSFAAAVTIAAALLGGTAAFAQEKGNSGLGAGDILLRGRMIGVIPDEGSTVQPIGGKVDLSNTAMPEADISYFATDNIAFELIASTTRHTAKDNGSTSGNLDLGSVWLLPPTLTAQWHFLPNAAFNPYVGAGINYTFFYSAHRGNSITNISYDDHVGWALQAGLDYNLGSNWFANVDLKKLFVSTTAHINNGAVTANIDVDPWIIGAGVGYRF